jgi:hypothetical protein
MRLPLVQRKIRGQRASVESRRRRYVLRESGARLPLRSLHGTRQQLLFQALTTREQACTHDYSLAGSRAYFINQSLNTRTLGGNLRSLG